MRNLHALLLSLTLLLLLGCVVPLPKVLSNNAPLQSGVAAYGEKVVYAPGQLIRFPDFTLTYVGTRHESSAIFPHGFDFHDFQIQRASESYTVSWSSGTGEVGPTFFAVHGQTYRLELVYSDQFTWLGDHELVIQPAPSS